MVPRAPSARYFSPLEPNRPRSVEELLRDNDIALYDRTTNPDETVNLATGPTNRDLVAACLTKLEALINAEIGPDSDPWVTEKPLLLGAPKWRGDEG